MRIVLICSDHVLGRLILPSLRRIGARFYLVCDRRAEHLRLSRLCRGVLLKSNDLGVEPAETVITAINQLVRSQTIDCVVASDVHALILLSGIKERIDCPTFPMAATDILVRLNNRWHFHNLCRRCGLDVPKTLHYPSKYQIDTAQIAASVGFPAVVKPVAKSINVGVTLADDPDTLVSAVIRNDDDQYGDVLVQEFVKGHDVGFGGLAFKGRLERWTTYRLHDDETVEFAPLPQLVEAARTLIAAENFTGVINVEARVDTMSGRIRLLECHPRFSVHARASRLCGLDFVAAGLERHIAARREPQSLVKGKFLPPGSLLSSRGWRQVFAGHWSTRAAIRATVEIFGDPLPLIAELDRRSTIHSSIKPALNTRAPVSSATS